MCGRMEEQHVRPSRPGLNGLPPSPDAGRQAGRQPIAWGGFVSKRMARAVSGMSRRPLGQVRNNEQVRIEGEPGEPLANVYLWLTTDEARELRDALDDLVSTEDPNWHAHVSSAAFNREITIALDA